MVVEILDVESSVGRSHVGTGDEDGRLNSQADISYSPEAIIPQVERLLLILELTALTVPGSPSFGVASISGQPFSPNDLHRDNTYS